MATAAVTNSFVANTLAESAEVNQNFTDLVNFINTNAIQKDASLAFTSIPSGPASDPTSDNQLSRKAYIDGRTDRKGVILTKSTQTISNNTETDISWDAEVYDSSAFITAPATTITVPSGLAGVYAITLRVGWDTGGAGDNNQITVTAGGITYTAYHPMPTFNLSHPTLSFTVPLVESDTVKATVYQSSSVSKALNARLSMLKIGV